MGGTVSTDTSMANDFRELGDVTVNKRYKLLKSIGKGSFGEVFLVNSIESKRKYAMKMITCRAKENTKKYETEVNLMKSCNHKSIVRVYESFVLDTKPDSMLENDDKHKYFCIIMEYCNGGSLGDLLEKFRKNNKKIPIGTAIRFFVQLIETLKYVHANKIIHRDIKPENILLCYNEEELDFEENSFDEDDPNEEMLRRVTVKITDFGVGRFISNVDLGSTFTGTVQYVAPEVFKREQYDGRCDVWSLGVILMQIASGLTTDEYTTQINDIVQKLISEMAQKNPLDTMQGMMTGAIDVYQILAQLVIKTDLFMEFMKQICPIDDPGIHKVIPLMIAEYNKRLSASALLAHPHLQVMKYLFAESLSKDHNEEGVVEWSKELIDSELFVQYLKEIEKKVMNNTLKEDEEILFIRILKPKFKMVLQNDQTLQKLTPYLFNLISTALKNMKRKARVLGLMIRRYPFHINMEKTQYQNKPQEWALKFLTFLEYIPITKILKKTDIDEKNALKQILTTYSKKVRDLYLESFPIPNHRHPWTTTDGVLTPPPNSATIGPSFNCPVTIGQHVDQIDINEVRTKVKLPEIYASKFNSYRSAIIFIKKYIPLICSNITTVKPHTHLLECSNGKSQESFGFPVKVLVGEIRYRPNDEKENKKSFNQDFILEKIKLYEIDQILEKLDKDLIEYRKKHSCGLHSHMLISWRYVVYPSPSTTCTFLNGIKTIGDPCFAEQILKSKKK